MLNIYCISDIHLGADNCQSESVLSFLKMLNSSNENNELVINGDLFDNLDFRRLKKSHWKILNKLRKLSEKIKVTFVIGNHDGSNSDVISSISGLNFVEEYMTNDVLFLHGHQFDDFITKRKVLTYCADFAYWIMQKIDPSHSLAVFAKKNCKTFLRNAQKISDGAVKYAKEQNAKVVICGHSHLPEMSIINDVTYVNSGSFTEKKCTVVKVMVSENMIEVESITSEMD